MSSSPVDADVDSIQARGIEVIRKPFMSARNLVRHDSFALADALTDSLALCATCAPALQSQAR